VSKDWTGNKKSTYSTIGASNHIDTDRSEYDYYATPPEAVRMLLELETFGHSIWEPACGEGHISEVLKECGYNVFSTDIIKRGYESDIIDFLSFDSEGSPTKYDIITNPPYSKAQQFIEKALRVVRPKGKVAMFLKIQFLEGKSRKEFFKRYPPIRIWVSSDRLFCAKNGEFPTNPRDRRGSICYAWFIWQHGYNGDTIIKWFN